MNLLLDFFSILKNKEKKKFLFIISLMFVGMVFEIMGISLIMPIISLFQENNQIDIPIINHLLYDKDLKKYLPILFILFYFLKTIFLILVSYYQNKSIFDLSSRISKDLIFNYLSSNFENIANDNNSKLIKNIQIEQVSFNSFVSALMTLLAEFLLFFSLVMFLMYINFISTIFVIIYFMTLSFIIFKMTRKKLKNWGKRREEIDSQILEKLSETFKSLIEIYTYKNFKFYANRALLNIYEKNRLSYLQNFLSQLPKQLLDFLSIMFISIFIIALYFQDPENLIPTLGLFSFALIKLIPSTNKILVSFQHIKYFSSSVVVLKNDIDKYSHLSNDGTAIKISKFKHSLELKNIKASYSNRALFNGFNLKIESGKFYGIHGPSGSGKSTLIKILLGLKKIDSGDYLLDGKSIMQPDFSQIVGFVPQETNLFNGTLTENIILDKSFSRKKLNQLLRKINLKDLTKDIDSDNVIINENGKNISGGQKQRIGILRALYREPKILILDESTSGLDQKSEKQIIDELKFLKGKLTIILISHNKKTLSYCDKTIEIKLI